MVEDQRQPFGIMVAIAVGDSYLTDPAHHSPDDPLAGLRESFDILGDAWPCESYRIDGRRFYVADADAYGAVAAAISLHSQMFADCQDFPDGGRMHAQIGVALHPRETSGVISLTGDTIAVAEALAEQAAPGESLVTIAVAEATAGRPKIVLADAPPVTVPGESSPIPVRRLIYDPEKENEA